MITIGGLPKRWWIALPFALMVALPATSASAQDVPVDTPESLVRTLDAEGVPLGSFVLYPRVTADVRYDTNVYNRPGGEGDALLVVRPAVRLASDFGRHAIDFNLSAEGRRYFDNPDENSEQWAASSVARLDLANRFVLGANVGIADRIERRGTLGDEFLTDEPVSFREIVAGLSLARRGGILEWQLSANTRRSHFDDSTLAGVPIDFSFRDVRRDSASWRVDYRGFSRLGLMGRITGTQLRYDEGVDRDSRGVSAIAGVTYRVTNLIDVEAGFGIIHHKPENPAEEAINALDYSLAGIWTPTPRTQFALRGARAVERSPFPNASSVLESVLEAEGTYAVGDRTLLGLRAGTISESYRGIDRKQTRYFAEASARYLLAPKVQVFAAVGGRRQDASGFGARSYNGATVRAGVTMVL